MLTTEERAAVSELLSGVPTLPDLLSLAATSTNGLLKPNTKEEAIEAIILHSASVEQVLNRKRVSKELLLNYLHWKKVPTPGTHDKASLIRLIVDHWQNQAGSVQYNDVQDVVIQGEMANTLALQFCDWFYKLYNTDISEGGLGAEHFWQDSSFTLYLSSNNNDITEEVYGSDNVVNLIKQVKQNYNLYFYPNLCSDGVRGKAQPNGIVAVLACGTLHQVVGHVFGTFEQMFILLKDPLASGNWKIKTIKAKLTNKENVSAQPMLSECELGIHLPPEYSDG